MCSRRPGKRLGSFSRTIFTTKTPRTRRKDSAVSVVKIVMSEPTLLLKPGREKSVLRRHPWIFSGAVAELRGEAVGGAALDAGREAQIVQRLSQTGDHPAALNFPEGEYLRGLCVGWNENQKAEGLMSFSFFDLVEMSGIEPESE